MAKGASKERFGFLDAKLYRRMKKMAQGLSPARPFRLEEAAKGASFKWGLRSGEPSTVSNMTQSSQERSFPCTVTRIQ